MNKPVSCCSLPSNPGAGKASSTTAIRQPVDTSHRFVDIPGGMTFVGTDSPYFSNDGEGPARPIRLAPYRIDPCAVTTAWFSEFVDATGYLTDAERYGASLVFRNFVRQGRPSRFVVGAEWWLYVEGADWAHPEGPDTSRTGREHHPVTHVSWNDATAFAQWIGGRLPTEAEWEHAARGGNPDAVFPWGSEEPDDNRFLPCNIWQGAFPQHDSAADGYSGTAPVDSFRPNPFGLYNMAGNVWEWCSDRFRIRSLKRNLRDLNARATAEGHRVLKGGSHLCHRSYCYRYRVAARIGVSPNTSAGHVGFRIVLDGANRRPHV